MIIDPIQHFLGVPATTDSLRLLGLAPGALDVAMIETALERQLARVYQHPDGRESDADRVRQRLRSAANELRQSVASGRLGAAIAPRPAQSAPVTRPKAPPRFRLTPFDRQVLAVLVGLGGWNARSRARLVALAGAYGVSVQGLLRVLKGLADYARGGGARLGVQDITGGQAITPTSADASIDETPMTPALLDRLASRLADELRREGRWPTIKLSLIFGSVTLVVGMIVMWWLVATSRPAPLPPGNTGTQPIAALPKTTASPMTLPGSAVKDTAPRVLTFRKPPTFLGNGLPIQAAAAADQINEHLTALDDVVRRLSVTSEPSEAVYRAWDDVIRAVATGWPLIDESARQGAAQKIDEVLTVAVGSPPVLDRLLRSLVPPGTESLIEPVDVWRGSWLAGTLGRVAASSTLPPVVIERVRNLLNVAFSPSTAEVTGGFNEWASVWLERILVPLVRSFSNDDRTYDAWELWIAAQRMLGTGERHQRAIMNAIEALLASSADLSQSGPAQNILGRLLSIAMEVPGEIVRDRIAGFYDNQAISTNDLWVMSSVLLSGPAARWMTSQLVVPSDADDLHRARLRDALARDWPEPSPSVHENARQAIGAGINPELAQRWLAALDTTLAQKPAASSAELVGQIVQTSRLIEIIDELIAKNNTRAEDLLDVIEASIPDGAAMLADIASRAHRVRPGQPLGMDGQWTAEYGELGRSAEDRLQSLRSLRTNAGTDLGPIDAATLVHEAYRGSTQDIRTVAMGIIADQFSTGPNVAMELLDQFPDARPTETLSNMIGRLTGQTLPVARHAEWSNEARLALVNHVMELRSGARPEADLLTDLLTASYAGRLSALEGDSSSSSAADSPARAARMLTQAWIDRAGVTLASNPVPADLGGIQQRLAIRLRLAEGPIQEFVAQQLAILDLLAYITVAEQPALREPVIALLRESAQRRAAFRSVLGQSLEAERAVAAMWRLRAGLPKRPVAAELEKEGDES